MAFDSQKLYENIKYNGQKYDEQIHCTMVLQIMCDENEATIAAFCVKAGISDSTFWRWTLTHPIFHECYRIGKMMGIKSWEDEGREIKDHVREKGETDNKFEYWRHIGWSRYGIGKNSRVRLSVDPKATADVHYSQLMAQAAEGEFTAGEIKQLVEAINVGLNVHQVVRLQKQIDEMKSDLKVMGTNVNVKDSKSIGSITEANSDSLANTLC